MITLKHRQFDHYWCVVNKQGEFETSILRVPGGALYRSSTRACGDAEVSMASSICFVPIPENIREFFWDGFDQ